MNDAALTGLKRTAELSAIFMIGNGVVGLLKPERHIDLWRSDVAAIDMFSRADRERSPDARRAIALLQIGAGLLLATGVLAKRQT